MTREVHPNEILVSLCIFAVLAAGIFGGGYWAGRSSDHCMIGVMTAIGNRLNIVADYVESHLEDPLSVSVNCHADASDWSTIRMANFIAAKYDIPAFIHGNCLTHNVVDVKPVGPALREYDCTDCRTIDQPDGCICDHGEALPDGH